MPTPVSTARQCLTHEAALALDDAVAVAKRRSHVQTTSLHAVSSLLSLPSSSLREACSRARNSAYTCRIQFKALELCLGVSLDRLPSSAQRVVEEPPVSNSLMAAIKRSQANQRRQPEHFQFYQQQQQQTMSSGTSVSTVKVELQNMILSILDDPVVSRVFADAGFRSCDIKLAIARPVHQLLPYKGPPLFLCNLTSQSDSGHLGRQGFSFPFLGGSRSSDDNENFKKIGEVLVRKRNPLLLGVSANGILENLLEMIRNGGTGLPLTLSGLTVTCIQNDVLQFVNGRKPQEFLKLRLEEVGRVVEECTGAGLLVNFGDLKVLLGGNDLTDAAVRYVVGELARLGEVHKDKVWLIGATAKHETYFEFLNKFPSIERDWDLQLLTLASPRPPMSETYPRSSIMESFVPFGGFFSTPSDMKSALNGANQYISRCHLCNEKCKQEVTALAEEGFSASVADQYQSTLPSWLQMTELSKSRELEAVKAKDSLVFMRVDVEKKWDGICQRLHQPQAYSQMFPKGAYNFTSQVPAIVGFQVEGRKENVDHCINITNASSAESGCKDIKSCRSNDLHQFPPAKANTQLPLISKSGNVETLLPQLGEKSSQIEELSARSSLSCSSVGDDRASPISANSVTTDLGLGVSSDDQTAKYSTSSRPVYQGQGGQIDFKMLYTSLSTRIGRQDEAVAVVSQTIACCRTRNDKRQASRGDVWFVFTGPDKIAKKKIAMGLAETLYESSDSFICVDLNLQGSVDSANVMFNPPPPNRYDVKFRGKTIVDYIAEELSKKPLSVVFLENVDMADLLAQSHLSRALKTGRFSDSHGREISISNAIFVATVSNFAVGSKILSPEKELASYSEEDVLRSKGCPFQMIIGFDLGDLLDNTRKAKPNSVIMNKRKLVGSGDTQEQGQVLETAKRAHKASSVFLDLNLPAEESEVADADHEFVTENTKAWLKDFCAQVDETVSFKAFDLDALAEKLMKEIAECFRKTAGLAGLLEIDSKVIEQILAAAYLLENNAVEDWIEQVLGSTFVEAQKRYTLSSRTVVKLVTCEGGLFPEEEQSLGNLLPARIIMS